jgi:hypothetical protein
VNFHSTESASAALASGTVLAGRKLAMTYRYESLKRQHKLKADAAAQHVPAQPSRPAAPAAAQAPPKQPPAQPAQLQLAYVQPPQSQPPVQPQYDEQQWQQQQQQYEQYYAAQQQAQAAQQQQQQQQPLYASMPLYQQPQSDFLATPVAQPWEHSSLSSGAFERATTARFAAMSLPRDFEGRSAFAPPTSSVLWQGQRR